MAVTKTLEDIITEQASIVCEQIEAAVAFADSEEDLRVEVEKAIEVFRKEADLPELKGHHEVTIGKGRADSVYDYVFIEYKKPGRLKESNDAPANREVIKQLQERAKDFKSELKRDPQELFGVGTDGNFFITGRFRGGKWEISPARERSVYVVEDFLRKLSSLGVAGKPFLADYLAGDFGAESERKLAREGIEKLYWRIREVEKKPEEYPKAKVLFDQWRILFGEVCGYDIKSPSSKIKQLGEFYGVKKDPNPAALLFAVHSYYALFMKFLAAEIATMFNPLSASFLARLHQTGSTERLREELRELEDGGIYRHLGIKNFLEGDLFSWYLDAWNDDVEKIIRQMVAVLDEYDPKTLSIDPIESRDLLKKLYQQLFPKTVRHDLGEYYTPDWLAELVIERVGYDGNPEKRVLDPACGSGTFLVMAINKVREYADTQLIPKHELLHKILNNVVGFDLNPLAVMAARTNYLLALRELLKLGGEIEIPIYLCDSIMTPAEYGELITKAGAVTGGIGKVQELKTSAGRFMIPTEIAQSRQTVAAYTDELEHCVRNDYREDEFISRLKGERIPAESEELHKALYNQVLKLKKKNQNDIWARIIKNSFAPLFTERADYVIGNPPWIRWENLPEDYRESSKHLWERYKLLTQSGWKAKIAAGKVDMAIMFVYVAVDSYLSVSGRLGFVITQTIFKSKGGGEGFRAFDLGDGKTFAVEQVDDLTECQVFEGATNRTAVLSIRNSGRTVYPVTYVCWVPKGVKRLPQEHALPEIAKIVSLKILKASPSVPADLRSPWLTLNEGMPNIAAKLSGNSAYRAREGVNTGGANGVFWLASVDRASARTFLGANSHKVGKKKVTERSGAVEAPLVFPLLRGRDVEAWKAVPTIHILLTHDASDAKHAIPEREFKQRFSKGYDFLQHFKPFLLNRPEYKRWGGNGPFYELYRIGDYTFAEWKVVFKEQATSLVAAVVEPYTDDHHLQEKPVIPDHKLMLVQTGSREEAHYLCALLNSAPAKFYVEAYFLQTSISTHVIECINVPKFDSRVALHSKISVASQKAHKLAVQGHRNALTDVEREVDKLAAELWGITPAELKQIQQTLKE